jgi:hypothetical protein
MEAAEMAVGRTASVMTAVPVGITTYDADGNRRRRRRRCPRGAATADVDVMMTMVGEMGGKATARQRRGNGKASTRQRQGNKKYAKATGYGAAGGRGNKAINKRITNNR